MAAEPGALETPLAALKTLPSSSAMTRENTIRSGGREGGTGGRGEGGREEGKKKVDEIDVFTMRSMAGGVAVGKKKE